MKWQLTLQSIFEPRGPAHAEYPAHHIAPRLMFDTRDDLVRCIRGLARLTGDGTLAVYADRVEREGEIMEQVVESMPDASYGDLRNAVTRTLIQELPRDG